MQVASRVPNDQWLWPPGAAAEAWTGSVWTGSAGIGRRRRVSADGGTAGERKPPPGRTPGQAEGTEDVAEGEEKPDPIRRRTPSQAEGEDPEGEADRVPRRD